MPRRETILALEDFVAAALRLDREWASADHGMEVAYPYGLPSFDEFVDDLVTWCAAVKAQGSAVAAGVEDSPISKLCEGWKCSACDKTIDRCECPRYETESSWFCPQCGQSTTGCECPE